MFASDCIPVSGYYRIVDGQARYVRPHWRRPWGVLKGYRAREINPNQKG